MSTFLLEKNSELAPNFIISQINTLLANLAKFHSFSSVPVGVFEFLTFDNPNIRRYVISIVESFGQKRRFKKWLGQQGKKAGKTCFGTRPSRSSRRPFECKRLQRFVGHAPRHRQSERKGSLSLVGSPRSPRRRQEERKSSLSFSLALVGSSL